MLKICDNQCEFYFYKWHNDPYISIWVIVSFKASARLVILLVYL